jgi:hypothetical protein
MALGEELALRGALFVLHWVWVWHCVEFLHGLIARLHEIVGVG